MGKIGDGRQTLQMNVSDFEGRREEGVHRFRHQARPGLRRWQGLPARDERREESDEDEDEKTRRSRTPRLCMLLARNVAQAVNQHHNPHPADRYVSDCLICPNPCSMSPHAL